MAVNYGGYVGAFVPTTNIWDVSELEGMDVTQPEFKELLVRLYQNMNRISQVLNLKETGYYYQQEFVTGQKFFPNPAIPPTSPASQIARQGFRVTVNFGALPNATTKSIPHGIPWNSMTTATCYYGASTNTSTLEGVPLPYASLSGDTIEVWIDSVNVNVATNSATWVDYTITYITIEYLKN
jgi:hypothetical protein